MGVAWEGVAWGGGRLLSGRRRGDGVSKHGGTGYLGADGVATVCGGGGVGDVEGVVQAQREALPVMKDTHYSRVIEREGIA